MNPITNHSLVGALESRSAGLTLNLSSNNPFRNRAVSPGFSSGLNSPLDPPPRPVSRNPFLDASPTNIPPPIGSPDKMSFATDATTAPRPALTGNAAELFVSHLILERKQAPIISNGHHKPDAMLEGV